MPIFIILILLILLVLMFKPKKSPSVKEFAKKPGMKYLVFPDFPLTDKGLRQGKLWAIDTCTKLADEPTTWAVLDTETTGLKDDDEIIELSILRGDGLLLYSKRLKPIAKKISKKASEIHGLYQKDIERSPTILDEFDAINDALNGLDIVLAYNAEFDFRKLIHSWKVAGCQREFHLSMGCAMDIYSKFMALVDQRTGCLKRFKLDGDHSALGDCKKTIELINTIAQKSVLNTP